MIDYYKLLSDPSHAWLNDPDSPFRTPNNFRKFPCIYFRFRTFKLKSYGPKPQRLKYPVAEKPGLRWYRNGSWAKSQVAYSLKLSAKERFNYQIDRLIKRWHEEAELSHCDHEKPYLVMEDDSLTELFHL
jgi:hypothetical protein